jgi:hypothetical protein
VTGPEVEPEPGADGHLLHGAPAWLGIQPSVGLLVWIMNHLCTPQTHVLKVWFPSALFRGGVFGEVIGSDLINGLIH